MLKEIEPTIKQVKHLHLAVTTSGDQIMVTVAARTNPGTTAQPVTVTAPIDEIDAAVIAAILEKIKPTAEPPKAPAPSTAKKESPAKSGKTKAAGKAEQPKPQEPAAADIKPQEAEPATEPVATQPEWNFADF